MKPITQLIPQASNGRAGDRARDLPCVTMVWVVASDERPLSGVWSIRLRDSAGRMVVRTEPFGASSNPRPRPPDNPVGKVVSFRRPSRRERSSRR